MQDNLNDDLVKLVRYTIVHLERDREAILHRGEEIVVDNLSDEAFATWMLAKHGPLVRPGGGQVTGGARRFLRICYKVIGRWPKQSRSFEKRQLDVLEEIRDALWARPRAGKGTRPKPYGELMRRLERSRGTFGRWREGLERCARTLSVDLAQAFNQHRTVGDLESPWIGAAELQEAFHHPHRFDRAVLDGFTGRARGDLRSYLLQPLDNPPQEVKVPPVYSVWGPVVEREGRLTQEITNSRSAYIAPDSPDLKRFLNENRVDLVLNAFTPELGLVRWSELRQDHEHQMRSVGYQLAGRRLLWVHQVVDQDVTRRAGRHFVVSVEFNEEEDGKRSFHLYAVHIEIDLDRCRAALASRR